MQFLTNRVNLWPGCRQLAPKPKVDRLYLQLQYAEDLVTQAFVEHSQKMRPHNPRELQRLIDLAG